MTLTSSLECGAQRAGRYKAAHAALEEPEAADPGQSPGQSPGQAPGQSWATVAKGCLDALGDLPEGANLGFLYATDALADDLGSIVTFLRERTGIPRWVGTVGLGVVASGVEYYDRPALVHNTKDPPRAVLHFSVAKQGGAAQVNVEPSALAASPLGACLKDAASRVQFPEMKDPVSFRLPVSARVSR